MAYAIRPPSILDESGRKVITIKTGSLKTDQAGDLEIGDSGQVIGFTPGAITNAVNVDCVMVVVGNIATQRWLERLEAGTQTKIQFTNIDNKSEIGDFFVKGRNIQWDNKSGTFTGTFDFVGGATRRV
jgi:hypothetical protein